MTTHFRKHHGAATDWRCHACNRLLGRWRGDRLHIHFKRGADYLVRTPATATCRGCGALNEVD